MKIILTIYACRLKGSAAKVAKRLWRSTALKVKAQEGLLESMIEKEPSVKKMKKPQRRIKIQQEKILIHHHVVGVIWIYVMLQ